MKTLKLSLAALALLAASLRAQDPGGSLPKYCGKGFPLEKIVDEFNQAGAYLEWVPEYVDCMAFAKDDMKVCEVFQGLDDRMKFSGDNSKVIECNKNFNHELMAASTISGTPKLSEVCDRFYKNEKMRYALVPIGCRQLVEHPGDIEGACRYALAHTKSPVILASPKAERMPRCESIFKWFTGPAECPDMKGKGHEFRCPLFRAYRIAYEARDAEKCGDSIVCRAMMGEGVPACKAFGEEHLARACREQTRKVRKP